MFISVGFEVMRPQNRPGPPNCDTLIELGTILACVGEGRLATTVHSKAQVVYVPTIKRGILLPFAVVRTIKVIHVLSFICLTLAYVFLESLSTYIRFGSFWWYYTPI